MDSREGSEGAVGSSDFYQSSDSDQEMQDATRQIVSVHANNSSKRKLDQAASSPDKRRKVSYPKNPLSPVLPAVKGLPPEIWMSIFLHLSPHDLGRLLQVNRAFLLYLTQIVQFPEGYRPSGVSKLLTSDGVWSRSRKMTRLGFPRPMRGLSERDMFALVGSQTSRRTCQFCHKVGEPTNGTNVWDQGPGPNGVRIIWPFGIRSCGKCLEQRTQKEISLLLSPASALLAGVPFVFLTQDLHVIYPSALSQLSNLPSNIHPSKCFYTAQVETIQREFEEARALGSAAAEEWLKGLEKRRQERVADSERCERWELKQFESSPASSVPPSHPPPRPISHSPSYPSPAPSHSNPPLAMAFPNHSHTPSQSYSPRTGPPFPVPPQPPTPQGGQRSERTIRNVSEAKAQRKADIERRCQTLDPPIPAKLLRHMESFKAALQIATPLTDQAWELLAPRLQAQRKAAEETERQQAAQAATLQAKAVDQRSQTASYKDVKELMDREWEESQRPTRDRLSTYADEIIRNEWAGGDLVNKDSAPKFAAAVLISVRRRYYSDMADTHKNPPRGVNADVDGDGLARKLVLDNMKWVFDNKIKHITERYRKELFLCSACEANAKFYGFEGVIQHFGAKHTNLFSVGNVVVSWKEAEWPEEPPFYVDPIAVRNNFYATSASAAGQASYGSYQFGGYSRPTTATPGMQAQGPYPLPQFSPGPNQYMGPFPPPNYPHTGPMPGFEGQMMHPGSINPGTPALNFQASPLNAYATPVAAGAYNPAPFPEAGQPPAADSAQVSSRPPAQPDQHGWAPENPDGPNRRPATPLDEEQAAVSSFLSRFSIDPKLDVLAEALSKCALLKPVKNAQGLSCKACRTPGGTQPSSSGKEEMKIYSTVSLVSHFTQAHVQVPSLHEVPSQKLDWKEDMIELPDRYAVLDLVHSPGMDDRKLRLLADAFPDLLPPPLPRIDRLNPDSPAGKATVKSEPGTDSKGTPTYSGKGTRPSSRGTDAGSSHLYPRPGEDEYDPTQPSLELASRGYRSRRSASYYRVSADQSEPAGPPFFEPRPVYYVARARFDDEYDHPSYHHDYADYDDRGGWVELQRGASPGHHPRRDRYSYPTVDEYGYQYPAQREYRQAAREMPREELDRFHDSQEGHDTKPQSSGRLEEPSRPGTPPAETETDKFLKGFLPNQDVQEYHRRAQELEQERENALRAKWEAERAAAEEGGPSQPGKPEMSDARPEPVERRGHPGSAQLPPRPPSTARGHPEGGRSRSPGRRVPEYRTMGAPHRRHERPYHVPARYARYSRILYHDDPNYHGQRIARSHSRFSRYEEQRRRLDSERLRSRSPVPSRRESTALEEPYPDRTADHAAPPLSARSSQPSPREPGPYDERLRHSPEPPLVRYRYDPPPTYVDEYGRPVQLVRAYHDPYGPPPGGPPGRFPPPPSPRTRYIAAGHRHPGEPVPVYQPRYEYVPYERMPPRDHIMPVYDDREYVYSDKPPRPFEGPQGGRERLGGVPPPPGPPPPPPPHEGDIGEGPAA